ncbi:hypothetical protein Landi51_07607 [Colletotrichum acutatum]
MPADINPQQQASLSLRLTDGREIDQGPVFDNMPDSLSVQEPVTDGAPILSQEQPIASEQPSFGSTGPKTEFHPSASLRVYAPFWKVWWKEILCIIASIASFIAIVIVLASYDNHNLPTWRFKITLNTFLAFFTTLAKGAFMLPVSLAFSQSKFTWFLKPNPLYDFYILDQASRGWLGSLKLLFRVRFKHTVTIGAILMIVSNLSSPVTQLAISYPLRNNTASEEEAKMFTIDEITLGHNYARKLAETASLKATLPDNGDYEVPAPPQKALCSTGNCDFGPYQSLGVCVKTANITSKLLTKPISNLTLDLFEDGNGGLIPGLKEWNVSLSGKYGMLHQSPLTVISGELEGADTFGYSNNTRLLKARLLFYFLIYTSPLSPSKTQNLPADSDAIDDVIDSITEFKYEAREVLFHICVQTFKTRVRAGLDETSISDTVSQIDDPSNGIVLGRKCTKEVCQPLEEPGDLVAQITPPNAGPRKFSASRFRTFISFGGWISFIAAEFAAAVICLTIVIAAQSMASREIGPENVYVPADVKDSALATLVVLSNDCREALSDGLQPADILQKTSKKLQVTLRRNALELAGNPEGHSSHPGTDTAPEVPTEEQSLPKKRFLGRILVNLRS